MEGSFMGLCSNTAVDVRPVVKNNNNTRHGIRLFSKVAENMRFESRVFVGTLRYQRARKHLQQSDALDLGGDGQSRGDLSLQNLNNIVLEGSCRYNSPVIVFEIYVCRVPTGPPPGGECKAEVGSSRMVTD